MSITILLCTDKSENALAAVSFGGRLAAALEAETTLLSVGRKKDKVLQAEASAQQILAGFGVTPRPITQVGRAVDEFIHHIQEKPYDLVVIGYRKRSALEKVINGCVASRIAHQASTSILIVRSGRPDLKKILVGIGGNGFTRQLSDWAARISVALCAKATLIHVDTAPPLMYAGLPEVQQTLSELMETDTPTANALRRAAEILKNAGVESDVKLVHGVAERELLRTAQEGDYDLIILGSSWARPSYDRLMLPNVTRNVLLKTRRPVLVVYP